MFPPLRGFRWLMLLGLSMAMGCAGYQVGTDTLYPPDIRTVYVPIFTSNSFRRNFGERLTEAVVKEIELKTPFKVVNTPDADSVLTGRLTSETKRIIVESPTDEPRETEISVNVEIVWLDRKGDLIQQATIPLPPEFIDYTQTATLVPEFGQSVVTQQQTAIERMAEQIVGSMEVPW